MPHASDSESTPPASTPARSSATPSRSTPSSYFTFPVSYAVNGLLRRLSQDPNSPKSSGVASNSAMEGIYSAPRRKASPFQPPPLTPLTLKGYKTSTKASAKLLTNGLAEEIRLLVPPRLQLVDTWVLAYSLEQDGVSLTTLYEQCEAYRGKRGGFVLVVRDGDGGSFGAYLSDAPRPSPHFYGTGECFLWRAHLLPSLPDLSQLPPPPSADTTNAQRMTTISHSSNSSTPKPDTLSPPDPGSRTKSGTATPDRIRFKAFPYSGVNDYMIFCETGFLSVGGGDGHYGLWLDDNLEKGISSTCPTFGNEPLSDEGTKFDVLGVEIWYIGS